MATFQRTLSHERLKICNQIPKKLVACTPEDW